jgi:murein DD-endopeptidase MepM/ murein hydrolase activator NlpD
VLLSFNGDPAIEPRPLKDGQQLILAVSRACLPSATQALASRGALVTDLLMEQSPNREMRVSMTIARGQEVSIYKRRDPARDITEFALVIGHPGASPEAGGELTWPVHGRLSSKFGWRLHPILHEHKMHSGIDIAVPEGTPIHAAAPGRVIFAGRKGGAGLAVIVDHGGGRRSQYCHCSKLEVGEGDPVTRDQVLALAGSTGLSTGPHVHFTLTENGRPVDPMPLLQKRSGTERKAADPKQKPASP